jgi:hypothetical protein
LESQNAEYHHWFHTEISDYTSAAVSKNLNEGPAKWMNQMLNDNIENKSYLQRYEICPPTNQLIRAL